MYLTPRFYLILMAVAAIMAAGYAWAPLLTVGQALLCLLAAAVVATVRLEVVLSFLLYRAALECEERRKR